MTDHIEKTKKMIAVMQAYVDGKKIEETLRFGDLPWMHREEPEWDWIYSDYRVAQSRKPSINWEHVDKRFNYLAIDRSGEAYLYTEQPFVDNLIWMSYGEDVNADIFTSLDMGDCDWKDSLVVRPGYDEEDNMATCCGG